MQGNGADFILINRGTNMSAPRRGAENTAAGSVGNTPTVAAASTASTASRTPSVAAEAQSPPTAAASLPPPLNLEVITWPADAPTPTGSARPPVNRTLTFSYGAAASGEERASSSLSTTVTQQTAAAAEKRRGDASGEPSTSLTATDDASALRHAAHAVADGVVMAIIDELFDRRQLDAAAQN